VLNVKYTVQGATMMSQKRHWINECPTNSVTLFTW